ncbi:MAG: hypothetical protein RI966_347, partial [Actinomycetota bacterium]
ERLVQNAFNCLGDIFCPVIGGDTNRNCSKSLNHLNLKLIFNYVSSVGEFCIAAQNLGSVPFEDFEVA